MLLHIADVLVVHRYIGNLIFLAPEDCEGGELLVEDIDGVHSVQLPAGHLVIYPSSSLHRVNPVLSGVRLAAFFDSEYFSRRQAACIVIRYG